MKAVFLEPEEDLEPPSRLDESFGAGSFVVKCMLNLVLLKIFFYFGPYLRAFWGLFFIFSRFL